VSIFLNKSQPEFKPSFETGLLMLMGEQLSLWKSKQDFSS